jgi:hypothetical protein
VFAVIVTVMVLGLEHQTRRHSRLSGLYGRRPISYAVSYLFIGIICSSQYSSLVMALSGHLGRDLIYHEAIESDLHLPSTFLCSRTNNWIVDACRPRREAVRAITAAAGAKFLTAACVSRSACAACGGFGCARNAASFHVLDRLQVTNFGLLKSAPNGVNYIDIRRFFLHGRFRLPN